VKFRTNGVFGHIWRDPEMRVRVKIYLFVYLGLGSVVFPIWILWRVYVSKKPLPEGTTTARGWSLWSGDARRQTSGQGSRHSPSLTTVTSPPLSGGEMNSPDDLPTPEFLDDYSALVAMPEAENPSLYKRLRELIDRMHEGRRIGDPETGRAFATGLDVLIEEYRKMRESAQ